MAIRDRVRRAFGGSPESSLYSSRSTSTSNFTSSSSSPESSTPPSLTLSKSLTRTITFRSNRSQKTKEERALEQWAKKDAKEWKRPSVKYPMRKSQHHQDLLRAFSFECNGIRRCRDGDSRNSIWSGISPCASRKASFAEPSLERVLSGSGSTGGRRNSVRKGSGGQHLGSDGGRRVVTVLEE